MHLIAGPCVLTHIALPAQHGQQPCQPISHTKHDRSRSSSHDGSSDSSSEDSRRPGKHTMKLQACNRSSRYRGEYNQRSGSGSDNEDHADTSRRGAGPRPACATSVTEIVVCNAHLAPFNDHSDMRLQQVSHILEAAQQLAPDVPVILCGDMNMVSSRHTYMLKCTASLLCVDTPNRDLHCIRSWCI